MTDAAPVRAYKLSKVVKEQAQQIAARDALIRELVGLLEDQLGYGYEWAKDDLDVLADPLVREVMAGAAPPSRPPSVPFPPSADCSDFPVSR